MSFRQTGASVVQQFTQALARVALTTSEAPGAGVSVAVRLIAAADPQTLSLRFFFLRFAFLGFAFRLLTVCPAVRTSPRLAGG